MDNSSGLTVTAMATALGLLIVAAIEIAPILYKPSQPEGFAEETILFTAHEPYNGRGVTGGTVTKSISITACTAKETLVFDDIALKGQCSEPGRLKRHEVKIDLRTAGRATNPDGAIAISFHPHRYFGFSGDIETLGVTNLSESCSGSSFSGGTPEIFLIRGRPSNIDEILSNVNDRISYCKTLGNE